MKQIVILVIYSIVVIPAYCQTIEHKWKASSFSMSNKFYELKDAENSATRSDFMEEMRKLNKLDTLSNADSLGFVMGYIMMMKIAKDLKIEFTKKGKVTLEGDIKWGKEIYKEEGSYQISKDRITTDLKDSKCTNMVILSLSETELVLGNMLGNDKIIFKFRRMD